MAEEGTQLLNRWSNVNEGMKGRDIFRWDVGGGGVGRKRLFFGKIVSRVRVMVIVVSFLIFMDYLALFQLTLR